MPYKYNNDLNESLITNDDTGAHSDQHEKDEYYGYLAKELPVDDYYPQTKVCTKCNEIFYFIRTKQQLLQAINEKITGTISFDVEMVRLYENSYFAGKDHICDWGDDNICGCCRHYQRRKWNNLGLFHKFKLWFKK